MGILEKFSAVEIKADSRISEEDKTFCTCQQEAFDKSGPALQKIADVISATRSEQFSILGGKNERYFHLPPWGIYIASDGFRCDESYVYEMMGMRNTRLIHQIVSYFQDKYTETPTKIAKVCSMLEEWKNEVVVIGFRHTNVVKAYAS